MPDRIVLAPMEGVVDPIVRELLTGLGGIDLCVTEFIRITDSVLPAAVFRRHAPELGNGGRTAAGVPVIVQLLGSRADMLAANAARAAALGAPGIDLNFGCPSKTVNRHRGGAVLLDDPEAIHRIVRAVRAALPPGLPVTAKMRLGNRDKALALDNAQAIAAAGAAGLTVHARTKLEGYRPPAHWEWIARIREAVAIPITANGEIWDWDDYQRCRQISGCSSVMIGRGLLARPHLAATIKHRLQDLPAGADDWPPTLALLRSYLERLATEMPPPGVQGRLKQWLHMMRRQRPEAQALFERVKTLRDSGQLAQALGAA